MSSSLDNSSIAIPAHILNWALSKKITFWSLIILIFPSVIGSFLVFYGVIRKKEIRHRIKNQLVLLILVVHFVQAVFELPFTIIYLHRGQVPVASNAFCDYWQTLITTLNIVSLQLNAHLSIERYLLIFHNTFIQKYNISLHYAPAIFLIIAPLLFTFICIISYPCESTYDYNAVVCGVACYTLDPILGPFTWFFWCLLPLVLVVVSNLFLIIQVALQKRRMLQTNVWKKNLAMTLQLFAVTGVLYVSWLPIILTSVINIIHLTPVLFELQANWLLLGLIYLAVLSSPLTATVAIPELKTEMYTMIRGWRRNITHDRIGPVTMTAQTVTNGTQQM
ncbi:unnamed protein product [Rotaria socialis]|uniref:G-protein coupled receptors family 1 profile domain-containing protein n=3 Tax=Rotaria socialis TaxID=392032 RepID=A0A818EWT3_9BILA|nr:unnamed protein product [Rotaria socialis]CAF3465891.1 unnamed protein product [Rotaria socialis]CAF4498340.1 unnamed protein product [Rotaria socialis]